MSTAIWVGAITGLVVGFAIQIAILFYLVKIWGVIEEAIYYGIVPGFLEGRAREKAIEILGVGWIHDRQEAERVCHILGTMKNDNGLYMQLSELLKRSSE